MQGHNKTAVYELGSWILPDTDSASTLILDFPASRTVANICCLSHPGYGAFVIAAWAD